jgi:ADP-ribose pyrophosphatase
MLSKPQSNQAGVQPPLSSNEQKELQELQISSKQVYRGQLAEVYSDQVRLPDGSESSREYLKHPGATAVLPIYDNGDIILLRQYRYPVSRVLWEIPAGKLSDGEDPLECGRRELREETGLTADSWQPLLSYHPCIGYSDEVIHIFLATGLHTGQVNLDQGEFLTSHRITATEVSRMLQNGKITDGKSLIALQWLQQRYDPPGIRSLLKEF